MNRSIELLQRAQGTVFVNEDGIEETFKLLPPLTDGELNNLQSQIPCPLPQEMRELLQFSRGFEGTALEIDFSGTLTGGFGMDEIFPCALDIAADGFGNYWIVDLLKDSTTWGPIFYACHDAPVIVFQTQSLERFIEEALRFGAPPWNSEINDVHEGLSDRIWSDNPGVLSHADCLAGTDQELRAFAETLDQSWQFIDLRRAKIGDGFSWGRYGAKTLNTRFGEKRVFAYQKKTFGRRFLDAFR